MGKPPKDQEHHDADPALIPLGMPPQPRKQPRQARSIALVEALKQAGRQILEEEGREALTALRLADVSGVAISSIYEYFPAMESLIAAVFEDYRREAGEQLLAAIDDLPEQATLFDGLLLVLRLGLAVHHRKSCLDPDFSERVTRYDELVRLELVESRQCWSAGATPALFERFAAEIRVKDHEKARFFMYQTLLTLPRAMRLERPHYLMEDESATMLARMLHGLLTSQA